MKRFNYTGRKKILREDVSIRLHGDFDAKPVVDVAVDLTDYDFPGDAEIYLEPQQQTRFMRLLLGECGALKIHARLLELTEFDDADGLSFRIKIVEPNKGKLLGIAENIKPYNKDEKLDDNQQSILPVRSTDLTQTGVLWRIGFGDQEAVLEIEKELGGKEQVVRSLLFRGFILPAAMRQILAKIVSDEWDESLADPQELSTRWLIFAKQAGAGLPDKNPENQQVWLDDAVRVLAQRIGVRQQVIADYELGAWK